MITVPSQSRRVRKEQTRSALMEAALELMTEQGIAATRTIDVAERAGVAHGTVFVHFATRDDLVAAVVGRHAGDIAGRLHELSRESGSVRAVLEGHLEGLAEHEAFYARLVMEGPLLPPYARSTLLGIQSAISANLAEAAEREMAEGRIRPMPVDLLFNTWLGLVHHYIANRVLFAPGQSVIERWGPTLLNHYLGLLHPAEQGGEQ
jgi:AcrR family transcriptional regulator